MVENNDIVLNQRAENRRPGCYSTIIREDNEEIARLKDRKGADLQDVDLLRAGVRRKKA